MVRHRDGLYLAVSPRTVGEVQIPVFQKTGLLVLQRLYVVGIVYLAVRYRAAVIAQVLVTRPCHHANHDAPVKQFLHVWAWLRGSLGCYVRHYIVLLILRQHSLRVGEVNDVVVERLNEVVVAVPPRYLVQIEVCVRAVEVDDVLKGRETVAGVYRHTGALVTVLEHLAQHNA